MGPRVIILSKLQEKVLKELHEVHFGIAHTKAIAIEAMFGSLSWIVSDIE